MTILGNMRGVLHAAAVAAVMTVPAAGMAQTSVTFAGFGGFVLDNELEHLLGQAKSKLNIDVKGARNGSWNGVKAHLTAGATGWDIISIGAARCEMAVQGDYILPIDYSIVDKSLIPPQLAGTHYVGVYTFAYGIVYQKAKYKNNPPKSWADFWDVKNFPGRRSLESLGLYAYEAALMADGVPKDEVYKVLRTQAGIDRAFKKLEQLKPDVAVYWTSSGQVMQIVRDAEVDMALISNGRAAELIAAGSDLGYVWEGGIIDIDCFMVPKTSTNPKAAMQLINLAFEPAGQARFAAGTKYGPVNAKAFEAGILKPAEVDWLPTAPKNLDKQIFVDPKWYVSPEATAAFERYTKMIQR